MFAATTEVLVTRSVSETMGVLHAMAFGVPHKKKSRIDKSSDHGGHFMAPPHPIHRGANVLVK